MLEYKEEKQINTKPDRTEYTKLWRKENKIKYANYQLAYWKKVIAQAEQRKKNKQETIE